MLDTDTVNPDPILQFRDWFDEAGNAGQTEVDAMTLSTVDAEGKPSSRIVLLKTTDDRGFVFYTNYHSRKGHDIDANPNASLVFWWPVGDRQVRVEGTLTKVPPEESDAYFASRVRESQLGAWASAQSAVLHSKQDLVERFAEILNRYEGQDVPRPPHWGGYVLRPGAVEFMERKPGRLHDRIRYTRAADGGWRIERLSP